MAAPVEEIDRDRRQNLCRLEGGTPVTEIVPRTRAEIVGDVTSVRIVPRAGASSLEVSVDDGYGRAVAVFFGRRQLAGMKPGRRIHLDGVAMIDHGRTVLYNPAYDLL
jgi:hypothetical protein